MTPRSFVRTARYADALHVLEAMRKTLRGQDELRAFSLISGDAVDEGFLVRLIQSSHDVVTLAPAGEPRRALAVAGFTAQRPGVSRTWMLATDEAWAEHGAEVTVYTERGISLQLAPGKLHRIETVCPDSHRIAKAWYPRLGLKQEATLAKFCSDGSDAALFVRLRDGG